MSLQQMYPAKNNSPRSFLTAAVEADSTSMTLDDASVLPSITEQNPVNLFVLGTGDDAEIVSYSAINGNVVSGIVRGINGTIAAAWPANTIVARNFTAQDAEAFRQNILDLDERKADKSYVDTGLAAKQNTLQWDTTPTAGSTKPVTSGGIKTALDAKMNENPSSIELMPPSGATLGGFIDFHYGGSSEDYTSRIIESSNYLEINGKPLRTASPSFTGTPTAPTAAKGTNTTQIATTAFVQTGLSDKADKANEIMLFKSQAVSAATNAQIMRIPATGTNSAITTDTVVLSCVWNVPANITSNVTWTSYAGYVAFVGTCAAATTADVILGLKGN